MVPVIGVEPTTFALRMRHVVFIISQLGHFGVMDGAIMLFLAFRAWVCRLQIQPLRWQGQTGICRSSLG